MDAYGPKSHAQMLKEDIWLMRLHRFCGSYRPCFPPTIIALLHDSTGL